MDEKKISWDNITPQDKEDLEREVYKFIDLKYLPSIFKDKKLAFLKVNKWDDPFENFIFKSNFKINGKKVESDIFKVFANSTFGQSWTLHSETDALWRIYSPNKNSVRIKTKASKLLQMIKTKSDDSLYCMLGDVEYKTKNEFENFISKLKTHQDFRTDQFHTFTYFVKRTEFTHEKEFRVIYIADFENGKKNEILYFNIDPNEFIIDILVDPRLTVTEFNKIKTTIRNLGYNGKIEKSSLYYWKPLNIDLKT
ncbi:DUF2971 domain-containing protein [Dokdonia sinensis]|uniref:DUF2971 domain-containing protein n=1 Tax=Dokdonia sinensis TaxID=2479847 RepID=A0A3M0G2B0_9FLAO|nr:DUF2971 domain-containing protein [Dokdonia sinensis]RMB56043.1 DUF2971 domain-containing protein [Dokdonia sinensis]